MLIDTQLVANAPVQFLVAGIGDALATWIEARASAKAAATTMAGGLATQAGTALAELSWRIIHENAFSALDAVRDGIVTPALESLVEANTLLSGLGFESGGLAAAHAIHNGLTAAPQTHGLTHGQKVNIGSLTQLVLEGAPRAEIEDFVEFTTRVGLPNTLTEIGLSTDDTEELEAVAAAATVESETIHSMPFPVTPDVVDALIAIEGLSRSIRADTGCPNPSGTSRSADGTGSRTGPCRSSMNVTPSSCSRWTSARRCWSTPTTSPAANRPTRPRPSGCARASSSSTAGS